MTVATPLSLNNVRYEFGDGVLSTNTYNSGSGTVTAPAGATSVTIYAWGGGGGGSDALVYGPGGGGGGGGYSVRTVNVTGGSTQFSYSVGAGGSRGSNGVAGGNSTVDQVGGSRQVTANGGAGGTSGYPGNGGAGGTASDGETNTSGSAGANGNGGGGSGGAGANGGVGGYGGVEGDGGSGSAPGGGGGGGGTLETTAYNGGDGAAGRIQFVWRKKALSAYTRGGGLIPNHAENSGVPTTTSGLGISNFSGASLNFTATVNSSGGATGYEYGVSGTINRDQFGISRANTNTRTLYGITQSRSIFYDLFGAPSFYIYTTNLIFLGDMRSSTLGYAPVSFLKVKPSGSNWSYVNMLVGSGGLNLITESYNGYVTTISNPFSYSGSLSGNDWLFAAGDNDIEIGYNTSTVYETIATQTITSGDYPIGSSAPLQAPAAADAATIRIWGGGAGGTGGQGGGGASYSEVINVPIAAQEQFIYTVGVGGSPGANGNTTSISSNTNILAIIYAEGGYANGSGGMVNPYMGGFFNPWTGYFGNNANGSSTGTSNGAAAGGTGGGAGGVGAAGVIPGGGGASGYSGARGEIQIEWKAAVPLAGSY